MSYFRFPYFVCAAVAAIALLVATGPARAQFAKPAVGGSVSAVVQTEQVRAELVAFVPDGVGTDKQVWVGLQLAHQPQWHTYWKNAGDSGLCFSSSSRNERLWVSASFR